ncbi:hypothetical protein COV19_03785 [Candidatus Woesearchaeota archaeon CG10_big_fil_rev_8_21_14_0_10_44_13]|nr:MAG: hypothetical protein COV19_03785 [Candidatus Woesearchaeota archaeon CG10_big_fil_rev_8_21_14_0_10_44_13]
MRFRLTPEERRARVSEGRWGWANPNRMTRREFIGLRKRMYEDKKRKEEEAKSRRKAQKSAQINAKDTGMAIKGRRGGKLKWLILLVLLAIAIYIYLRKTGRIPPIINHPWIERFI